MDGRRYSEQDLDLPETNPSVERRWNVSDGVLSYSGPIDAAFQKIIEQSEFTTLHIVSDGGLVHVALTVGQGLRARGIGVHADGECVSACVLVLAGGVARTADPDARIGVHEFSSADESMTGSEGLSVGQRVSSVILGYLARMDIDQELFHASVGIDTTTIRYLSEDELRAWRLLSGGSGTPFKAQAGMDLIDIDLPQGDFQKGVHMSYEDCKRECDTQPRCLAITYNEICWFKETVNPPARAPGARSWIKPRSN
jgi:hypothetical protein